MSKTIIRTHKFQDAKMCRRVPGYGVNETYPSTMEVVAHWAQTPRKVEKFIEILQRDIAVRQQTKGKTYTKT